jgi:hypothetical protein
VKLTAAILLLYLLHHYKYLMLNSILIALIALSAVLLWAAVMQWRGDSMTPAELAGLTVATVAVLAGTLLL